MEYETSSEYGALRFSTFHEAWANLPEGGYSARFRLRRRNQASHRGCIRTARRAGIVGKLFWVALSRKVWQLNARQAFFYDIIKRYDIPFTRNHSAKKR